MSGIFDQVINYAPPSLLKGTVTYKGTWSAATNTPTLVNPPDSTTNGFYYVVSAAGTQFSLSFNIGDWIISNGSAWEKVDNTDAVSSVFGRMGAVVGVSTDYSAVGITNTALGASNPSTVAATTVTATSTIAATGAVTGSNLSGTNTGDQTITLTGGVTGSGTGSFAATVVTNANLTGGVTSVGNAATVVTNANLTGVITSSGNATSIASQTGTGTKFVVDTSPTLVTPNIGVATGTSLAAALNGTLGATTPSTVAGTTGTFTGNVVLNPTTTEAFKLRRRGSTSVDTLRISSDASADLVFDNDNSVYHFQINGSEKMTLTSTGLNSTAIGATTPSTGAFTTLSASGTGRFTNGNLYTYGESGDSTTGILYFNVGATNYIYGSASQISMGTAGVQRLLLTSTGLAVTGTLSATGRITGSQDLILGNTYTLSWGGAYGAGIPTIAGSTGAGTLSFYPTGTTNGVVASISSTGAAITGALSATGNITTNGGSLLNNSASSHTFYQTTPTTGGQSFIDNLRVGSSFYFRTSTTTGADTTPLIISSTGLAVTGTLSATGDATLSALVMMPAVYNNTTGGSANLLVAGDGGNRLYRSTSSRKYKEEIKDYTSGLLEVLKLRPVFYKGKNKEADKDKQFAGLIAEEVDEVGLKEFVVYDKDGSPDALDYSHMVALAFKAIQEQDAQIKSLTARLAALESK